jgi:hypothetical protein
VSCPADDLAVRSHVVNITQITLLDVRVAEQRSPAKDKGRGNSV